MAAARERNDNSYEDGGGFGKFRKRPFRRVQATPYDRPPTAIRNPSHASNTNNNNGWLSKLVDPAQRLITSSAHRFFASMFRKRLPPPPPPQPPEPEAHGGAPDEQKETIPKDPPGIRGSATNEIDNPDNSFDKGGLTKLELILKQKTFTRSEIDRLTALLQSRTVDADLGNQEKKSEVIPSEGFLSLDRKEFPHTPIKDNGLESHPISTPNVLDEDVASPAELAKAYMGSRPSKISPSVLGLSSRAVGEHSIVQIDRPVPSKSTIMSVVPRSSGRVTSAENGFVTPRSHGRSAIYSMARTPYSRVHSSSTLQGAGSETNVLGLPSFSSPSIWENSRFSGSKQRALKRRSSVLENDIGSVGPIRRIRQKSNLLPSSSSLSIRGSSLGSDSAQLLSSSQKLAIASEGSVENGDTGIHGSSFAHVPSKSSEMASKILQQLDMLVSSREKSPTKLSPSMLRGPALRSLENVDSSKFLETVQDNNKTDVKYETSQPDVRDSLSQKQDRVEENGHKKLAVSYEKSASAVNGTNPANLVNNVSDQKTVSFPMVNSVAQPPTQKKWAFQMSAHEDDLELDDDENFDRSTSAMLAEEKQKLDTALPESKASSAEAITSEKPAAFLQFKSQASAIFNQNPPVASGGSAGTEKNSGFSVPAAAPLPNATVQQAVVDKQATVTSDKASSPNESSAALPIFNFGDKVVSQKEPNGVPPKSNFSSGTGSVVPQMTFASNSQVASETTGLKFDTSNPRSESPSSFAFNAVDATKPGLKEPESDKTDSCNSLKAGVFFSSNETLSSTVSTSSLAKQGIISFGVGSNPSIVNGNGSLADSTRSFSSPPTVVPDNISVQNSSISYNSSGITPAMIAASSNATNISKISASASAPSLESGSAFKFGSSSTSTSSISATTGVGLTEIKKETNFVNLVSAPFSSTSSVTTSTGGSLFGGTSTAMTSTGSNILDGTSSAVVSSGSSSFCGTSTSVTITGSSIFSFNAGSNTSTAAASATQGFNPFSAGTAPASGAGSLLAATTQSMPIQFSSSTSFPFGLTASPTFSSGSSLFSSPNNMNKLFSSGATFGLTSTSSDANTVGSTTSSMSTGFGSTWQTPKSPIFNSASSSTGFAFGASSSSSASSTTSVMFGSSTNASSDSVFSFSSPAASTPPQPVFGNTNPAFTFGSSPSGNSDQMNMEDSMAEDTVQTTTSAVPVFGQQPVAPPSSSFVFGCTAPSTANQFGSAAPSGGNQFGSTAPSGANPFQFGSQSNLAVSQNQSPFQASGSLEFNARGSFSLGTGGSDKSGRKFVRVRKTQRKK
ncbi:nuclear pore complex protein NUP1 isoform X3 [Manihot esculenta]|uniref:Uncharacterized protein n=1 Tax=Manihot esculenta TaxID=3983 RepID=A0ACB7H0T9_MANES|nr:nuclear pore complex protein NUP1 isoform X3 [Manihot esculenta]KAG8645363.1 hypothetical protein MANES_10G059500v8 [Manihot esculenta]